MSHRKRDFPVAFLLMTEQTRRALTLVFVAFFFSTLVYLFIGFILNRSPQEPRPLAVNSQVVLVAFLVLSVAQVFFVWFFKRKVYSDPDNPGSIQALENRLRGKHIILFALSEVPAIYGIVYFLLTGHFTGQIVLTFLSWICLFVTRPSATAIEELERRFGY